MKYTGFTINSFISKYKGNKKINLYISGSRKLKNSDYSNFDFGEEFEIIQDVCRNRTCLD